MYSQSGFHHELAHDRQRQLIRDSGVDFRTAPHVSEAAATERAELAAERRQALRFEPRQVSGLAILLRRLRGGRRVALRM